MLTTARRSARTGPPKAKTIVCHGFNEVNPHTRGSENFISTPHNTTHSHAVQQFDESFKPTRLQHNSSTLDQITTRLFRCFVFPRFCCACGLKVAHILDGNPALCFPIFKVTVRVFGAGGGGECSSAVPAAAKRIERTHDFALCSETTICNSNPADVPPIETRPRLNSGKIRYHGGRFRPNQRLVEGKNKRNTESNRKNKCNTTMGCSNIRHPATTSIHRRACGMENCSTISEKEIFPLFLLLVCSNTPDNTQGGVIELVTHHHAVGR